MPPKSLPRRDVVALVATSACAAGFLGGAQYYVAALLAALVATALAVVAVRARAAPPDRPAEREPTSGAAPQPLTQVGEQHEKDRLLHAVVESSNDVILALDANGVITACNPSAEQLYGLAAHQLKGKSVIDLFPPARKDEVAGLLGRVRWGETVVHQHTQHVGRMGRNVDVSVRLSPLRTEDGRIIGIALVARDVADHKQAEERFRLVVESSPSGLVLADAEGRIVLVNAEAERMFGYTREQMLGEPVEMLLPATLREAHVHHRRQFHEQPSARRMGAGRDLYGQRSDGKEFPVEVGLSPLHTSSGTLVLATVVDITERKRAEAETRKLETRLRQSEKLEAIGQLAGGVAHDFNNVLTAILGYVETAEAALQGGAPHSTADMLGYLDQIKKSGLWASDLTRRLLAFGRKQVAQPRPLDLNDSVRNVEPILRRLLPENVELVVSLAADLHHTLADAGQIEQVIVNLVVNSRDAMPTGGRIVVATENTELDDAYVMLHPEAKSGLYVALDVTDVGCGMDPATVDRIFDPFFSTKPTGQGTGMGLSTVYGIVQQAGGHTNVYSEIGKGTRFKVYLPAVDVPAAARPVVDSSTAPTGQETVLVTEDNDMVRWVIQNVLRNAGYNVILAENGAAAIRAALDHKGKIDLLISDIVMPGMHGRELAERLAAEGMLFKVLFVSGYTSDVIAHHGVLEPGLALLEKPFTRQALLQRVRQVLDSPTTRAPGAGSSDACAAR